MRLTSKTFRVLGGLSAGCGWLVAAACPAHAQTVTINTSGGTGFDRGIFGQNAFAFPYDSYTAAGYDNRKLSFAEEQPLWNNTSLRGMAGGAFADTYNWKTGIDENLGVKNSQNQLAKGMTTLDQLRAARDRNTNLILTVNTLKVGDFDSNGQFVSTDIYPGIPNRTVTAESLAGDWVRYTNFIVQNYRQGQESQMSADDQRILNEINWTGSDYGTDKLLKPGEAAVPKVNYWEIGNEVEYNFNGSDYRTAYHAITTAMIGVDPTIKVGPGMAGAQGPANGGYTNTLDGVLKPSSVFSPQWEQVDFVAYHPYGYQILNVDAATNHAGVVQELNNLKTDQLSEKSYVTDKINQNFGYSWYPVYRPGASSVQLMATEWNPAYPDPPQDMDNNWKLRQWNGLGVIETAMSFAEMGTKAANFWLHPAKIETGEKYSQYYAIEALNKFGGDTLVKSYQETNHRLYVTRDSATGTITVWGLNFLFGDPGDADWNPTISLTDLGITPGQITLMRLANLNGVTTLLSGNLGPTVGWITTDMTGMNLSSFQFNVKPAELSMLVIQVPEPSTVYICLIGLVPVLASRSISRRKACAFRRNLFPS